MPKIAPLCSSLLSRESPCPLDMGGYCKPLSCKSNMYTRYLMVCRPQIGPLRCPILVALCNGLCPALVLGILGVLRTSDELHA